MNYDTSPTRVNAVIEAFKKLYPTPVCALHYSAPHELLFAVILSAQCTDARVNLVTPMLFERFPTLEDFAAADVLEVEELIHSCGFFHQKARALVNTAQILCNDYNGKLPDTLEALTALPGVGRKTANLILGDIYHKPASVVTDTHCIRIANRLEFCATKEPIQVERALRAILPPEESSDFCHRCVLHGRALCMSRKPNCANCPLMGELCRGA